MPIERSLLRAEISFFVRTKSFMKKYLLLAIAVIVLAAGSYLTERSFLASSTITVATSTDDATQPASAAPAPAAIAGASIATTSPAQAPNVTFVVSGTSYGVYAPAGATVLDAMRTLASTTNFAFTGRESSGLGFFVDSINGKSSAGGSYWFLYVNGKSSDTGASATALHAGDTVEWRYEKNY